jgi:uncharacterized protein (TIGR03435 family)
MMTRLAKRKPGCIRKWLSNPALAFAITSTAAHAARGSAQPAQAAPAATQDISATWQGTLHAGQDLRVVAKISKADGGGYKADFYSIDQGGQPIPVDKSTLEGGTFKMSIKAISGSYEGKLSADGKTITGNWTQGPNPLALNFTRATPETEWSIPTPPPPVPPMAADAALSFDVATIKPSVPNRPGKGFGYRNGHFMTINTDMNDLIAFAYGLHTKQIINGPEWFGTDLFDIEGKPDAEGRPNQKQIQLMVQKLLVDRFKLTFHHDQRELSVYVIGVASGGPKMTKSSAAPNDLPGFGFRALGDLNVHNMTMKDFATWMQNGVMDKPVMDQTGLTDRYDFQLKWTPDESQFAAFRSVGAVVPPPTDDPKAPPALYTAIQEQLGLKMGPAKAPDEVIVIDHVEKPSAN